MPPRPLNELPPSSWSKNPHYVVDLDPLPFRLRAEAGGEAVLDSRAALVMFELGHAPVYYVPQADLRMALFTRNDHGTHCPYKGDASYWDLSVGGRRIENAVWSYLDPYPEMARLKNLIGVYWEKMDAWHHDDVAVTAPVEIAGRVNQTNNFAKCYPALAEEWHGEKNARIKPYEFAADSNTVVWWRNAAGEAWEESIKARVLEAAIPAKDRQAAE